MLYTLDAVTALVRALQGKNQSKPIGDKETRRFSCEMSYSKGTAHREIRNSTKTKVAHLLGYLLADTHEGVLGKIIAGSQNNNSFLDAKLVVEHQTIEYENTNITFEVSKTKKAFLRFKKTSDREDLTDSIKTT